MPKRFQKKIEDFTCEQCGVKVKGNGYTNHCPECLWSKHVDINPGDRAAQCNGMMEPTGIKQKNGKFAIIHKCVNCDHIKINKVQDEDNFDEVIKLMNKKHKVAKKQAQKQIPHTRAIG